MGRPSGLPVPSFRFANPVMCPPTPFGDGAPGSNKLGAIVPNASAHPEQTHQLISIVAQAIRAAALAPSEREALDIAGAALAHAVSIIKADSNQRSAPVLGLYSADRFQ